MDEVAGAILAALGGRSNVLTNTVCMTRLRVTLRDPQVVDFARLNGIQNVLGVVTRGDTGLEVVFGPRIIDSIYHAFIRLTGIPAGTDALFPMSRPSSNMSVKLSPAQQASQTPTFHEHEQGGSGIDPSELSILRDLFDDQGLAHEDESESDEARRIDKLLVINGPNVNIIGIGTEDEDERGFAAALELVKKTADELGIAQCDCIQSNHEGDLIDHIQDAYCMYDAIVINPGSLARTSIALRDAIRMVGVPTIEVHLLDFDPNPDAGESVLSEACIQTIESEGIEAYATAVHRIAEALGSRSQ